MLSAAQVLAANNFGDTRTGGLAGPMGLFLLIALAVATVLLIRNMNARLRRLPDRFPDQPGQVAPAEPAVTGGGVSAVGGADRGESASEGR